MSEQSHGVRLMCTFNTLKKIRMMTALPSTVSWESTNSIADITPSAGLSIMPSGKSFGIDRHGFLKNETNATQRIPIGIKASHH